MKVLVACEFSGIVREAFKAKGHDAWSCDWLPTEIPGQHIQGDVVEILDDGWDMMIAHPPCTYLSNSGRRWLVNNPERYKLMVESTVFFNTLLSANIPKRAIENPVQHDFARKFIRSYDDIIEPFHFFEMVTKRTCLWLVGLPPLIMKSNNRAYTMALAPVDRMPLWALSPGPERSKKRSVTYQGIADAMAEQWG